MKMTEKLIEGTSRHSEIIETECAWMVRVHALWFHLALHIDCSIFRFNSGLEYFQILNTIHTHTHTPFSCTKSEKKSTWVQRNIQTERKTFAPFHSLSLSIFTCENIVLRWQSAQRENIKVLRVVFCWHSTAYVNMESTTNMHARIETKKTVVPFYV